MVRGEVWWAATPGGDRPVLVLTRDPLADRIGAVVVAACTRTVRGVMSELPLGPEDGMPTACVASFGKSAHASARCLSQPYHASIRDQNASGVRGPIQGARLRLMVTIQFHRPAGFSQDCLGPRCIVLA